MPVKSAVFILTNSNAVKKILSTEFDGVGDCYRLKIRAELSNSWILQIWEHRTPGLRRYSYHVFKNSTTVIRWDNAPHHPDIKTFPHHKHIGARLEESEEMSLPKALKELERLICG